MSESALVVVFGRAHVALVHFPVALLLVAAVLACWRPRNAERLKSSHLCLALGLAGALAAAASGWVLADADPPAGPEADTFAWHRATALLATGAALLAWLATRVRALDRAWLRTGSLVAAGVLVGFAGHLGGTLVHGENWYTAPFAEKPRAEPPPPAEPPPAEPAPAEARVDFATQVFPILQARCLQCHGPEKVRGKLRLDQAAFVFDPARRERWVIEPGAPERSELLRRVQLPPDDEDHMPGKGEPLDGEQIATLRAWIAQGADWPR